MAKLDTIELFIDENADKDGIEALSLVKFPATEETWVALNNHRIEFKSIDDEKRIIIGLALVPDKLIYRRNGDYEYNITFSKETVNKAARLYLKKLNNNNATLEHKTEVDGVSVVESWTVENPKMDKTALYDLNAVEGSWAVIMSIDNDKVWQEIKNGTYLGISVEGYFSDEQKLSAQNKEEKLIELIKELILADEKKNSNSYKLESYTDYPDSVSNNAKRGIALNEKNGNKCATQVGKVRAQQLANKEPISLETIKRMYSYLSRAKEYYNENDTTACGTISYLLWGGDSALNWSESKLKQIENE